MTALLFSRNSKIAPQPNTVNHNPYMTPGYTCHMAVMHWAFMTLGRSQAVANDAVGRVARAHCPGCTANTGLHGSMDPASYGALFCSGAIAIPSQAALLATVDAGDVLITENPRMPMHSMVVRQKRGAGHVTVRGFNNFGTLGTGVRDQYDDSSHNIAKGKYWNAGPGGPFGMTGVALFVVKHDQYMIHTRNVLHHAMAV